jgi:hypothetical protein
LAALDEAISKQAETIRRQSTRLASMLFGPAVTREQIEAATLVVRAYLHDYCLIQRISLLDVEGEPEILAFRAALLKSLAISAIGALMDYAEAPVLPCEPYPAPATLLDELQALILS